METKAMIAHSVAGVSLVGLIVSWFIMMGGLSAVQKSCNGRCRELTGLSWWIWIFQAAVIFLIAGVQFVGGLSHGRQAVAALLAILAALEMYEADKFLNARASDNTLTASGAQAKNQIGDSRYNTAVAGFVLLAVFNVVAIVLLSMQPSTPAAGGDGDVHSSGTTNYGSNVGKSGGTNASMGGVGGVGGEPRNLRPFQTARSASGLPQSQPPAV